MVSIAVLAMVLVTLFKLQSSTIRLAESGQFSSLAPLLAREQLSDLAARLPDLESLSGRLKDPFSQWAWTCRIETAQVDTDTILSEQQAEKLKKIILTLTSPKDNKKFQVTTWRYRP
jgi:hypothetical protein